MPPFHVIELAAAAAYASPWRVWVARPPGAGMRDVCGLWHSVFSANDEPDGRRFGDHLGLVVQAEPMRLQDGWRVVLPEDARPEGWMHHLPS